MRGGEKQVITTERAGPPEQRDGPDRNEVNRSTQPHEPGERLVRPHDNRWLQQCEVTRCQDGYVSRRRSARSCCPGDRLLQTFFVRHDTCALNCICGYVCPENRADIWQTVPGATDRDDEFEESLRGESTIERARKDGAKQRLQLSRIGDDVQVDRPDNLL